MRHQTGSCVLAGTAVVKDAQVKRDKRKASALARKDAAKKQRKAEESAKKKPAEDGAAAASKGEDSK